MTMTQHLNILMPGDLLEALDTFAAKYGSSRSKITRLAIWRLLNAPEAYIAPSLPNWQSEAWTALLRGIYGDKRLVLTADIEALLRQAVAALDERSAQVLRLRFGLDGARHTLAEVGAIFGVNRQRARQVERTALGQARRWLRGRGIWDLLERQLSEEKV